MKVVRCSSCARFLHEADLRYIVGVHVTLDVDGLGHSPSDVQSLAQALDQQDAEESGLADVFCKDLAFVLCTGCRNDFVRNPLNRRGDEREADAGLLQ